jgi:hypothetical protein
VSTIKPTGTVVPLREVELRYVVALLERDRAARKVRGVRAVRRRRRWFDEHV